MFVHPISFSLSICLFSCYLLLQDIYFLLIILIIYCKQPPKFPLLPPTKCKQHELNILCTLSQKHFVVEQMYLSIIYKFMFIYANISYHTFYIFYYVQWLLYSKLSEKLFIIFCNHTNITFVKKFTIEKTKVKFWEHLLILVL